MYPARPAGGSRHSWRGSVRRESVYANRSVGGSGHVLEYLGRYTYRGVISNTRVVASSDGTVHSCAEGQAGERADTYQKGCRTLWHQTAAASLCEPAELPAA
jgi:hypothetical protein